MYRTHSFCLTPLALALALSALPVCAALASEADAQQQQLVFDLPAGPLDATLTAIARYSGRSISYDAALTRGLNAPALRGQFSTEQALHQALQGTALQLNVTASGALSVEPHATDALHLADINVSAQAFEQDAWGPAYSKVARRSATMSKTDTPLVEIPQSISVITREEMVSRQHDSLADVLGYTAGVVTQPNGYSRVADDYRLRGFDIGPRTGSVLRDGMKMQSTQFEGGQEPYGLERVEVLKGASSVLYGQLAPGGLINTISKRPTLAPLHELNLEYGNHQRRQISIDHSGALDEEGRFSYRLTALVRDSGTQLDAIDDDKQYIAPALTWQMDDDTRLTLLASHQRTQTTLTPPIRYNLTTFSDTPGYKVPYDLFPGEPDYDDYDGTLQTFGYLFERRLSEPATAPCRPLFRIAQRLRLHHPEQQPRHRGEPEQPDPKLQLPRGHFHRLDQRQQPVPGPRPRQLATHPAGRHRLLPQDLRQPPPQRQRADPGPGQPGLRQPAHRHYRRR